MIKTMYIKLKDNLGETLVETLIAMLIATLSMTILAGAIVSTVRLKKTGDVVDSSLSIEDKTGTVTGIIDAGTGTVKIGEGENSRSISVTIKSSGKEDLFFYEKN